MEDQPTLRVALAQLEPAQGDVEANVRSAVATIAAHRDCGLIVFPELSLSGVSRESYDEVLIDEDGPELARIGGAAREAGSAVVLGAALRRPRGTVNAALAIGPDGELSGVYEKTHRWDSERRLIEAGPALAATEVGSLRAGLMICFDVEFPEVARALTLQGPQLLITIAANMEPFGPDHALLARARAVENRLPHVYVNRTGSAAGSDYVGESFAVDAKGELLVQAGREPAVLEIELELGGASDPRVDYLGQRRPDLYGSLAEPRRP